MTEYKLESNPVPLPSAIKIGHLTYTVRRDRAVLDHESAQANVSQYAGLSNASRQEITLNVDMAPDYEADTLLHEILHSCLRVAGVDPDADAAAKLDDVEERTVKAIAGPLLSTLRENPDLLRFLVGSR